MHYKKLILTLVTAGMLVTQCVPAYADDSSTAAVSSSSVSISGQTDTAASSSSVPVSSDSANSAGSGTDVSGNDGTSSSSSSESGKNTDNTSSGSATEGDSGNTSSASDAKDGGNSVNTDSSTSSSSASTDQTPNSSADSSKDGNTGSTAVSSDTKNAAEKEASAAAKNDAASAPVVPANVAGTVDQSAAEKETFAYLTEYLGLNNAAAAGLLANFYQETMFQYKAIGGNGIAYGLAQWTGGNFTSLASWCSTNSRDYTTIDGQMHYLKYDLETNYPAVYAYLKNLPNTAEGAAAAAAFFCTYYERPANTQTRAAERTAYALQVFWPRYQSYILEEDENVKAYMDWLSDNASGKSQAYSSDTSTRKSDNNPYAFLFYALYDNGYLLAENGKVPFDSSNVLSELSEHGFVEEQDAESDGEKLKAGDIVLYENTNTACIYRTAGLVYQTSASDASDASSGTDQITSGELDTSVARKVFRLQSKDTELPSLAAKMVDQLSNKLYMYSDNIRQIRKTDDDSYTFLFNSLKSNGELSDVDTAFTKDTMDHVLCTHSYQNIAAEIGQNTASLSAGDIVWDPDFGAAVYLGKDRYIFLDNDVDLQMSRITGIKNCRYLEIRKITGKTWTAVYHRM
ncbi:MAG: phage tail tip lysozyme [Bilifractor sp.]